MKKVIIALFVLLTLVGCSAEEEVSRTEYDCEIQPGGTICHDARGYHEGRMPDECFDNRYIVKGEEYV